MDDYISVWRIFLRYLHCKLTSGKEGLAESLRQFCSSRSRANLKTLIRNHCHFTWQYETDSKLELSDYCRMKIGNRILNILEKNKVSY